MFTAMKHANNKQKIIMSAFFLTINTLEFHQNETLLY